MTRQALPDPEWQRRVLIRRRVRTVLETIAGSIFLVAFIGFWFWLLTTGNPQP